LKISKLRLNILLYSKLYLNNKEILEIAKYNLRICLKLVLIVNIKLVILSARSIAIDFCDVA